MKITGKNDAGVAVGNDWATEERRAYERHKIDFYLRVIEVPTHLAVGDAVDISLSGLQVVRAEPIQAGVQLNCVLEASLESGLRLQAAFNCRSVWCQRDDGGQGYRAGLEFVDPSLALEEEILRIIEDLG